jgi:hypothetical protein
MIKDGHLTYRLIGKDHLTEVQIKIMYDLMQAHYDHVTPEMFYFDLSNKQYIGLIEDEDESLQGFTTYVIDPKACCGKTYHIIFSGDTIIHRDHWGSQIMMKGWCFTIGRLVASDNSKPWFWYLMSKGHRTYMYLPLFFKSYYPSLIKSEDDEILANIANEVSFCLYGADWKPESGLIKFKEHHGELNTDLAEDSFKKAKSSHVRFFLEKNPDFAKGDELVCIAQLHPDNLIRTARDFFVQGMNHPIDL